MSSLLTKNFDNPLPATIPIRCLLSSNKASAGPVIIDIAEKFYELLDSPSLEYDYHYEFGSCTVAFNEGDPNPKKPNTDNPDAKETNPREPYTEDDNTENDGSEYNSWFESYEGDKNKRSEEARMYGQYVEVRLAQKSHATEFRSHITEVGYVGFPLPQRVRWEFRPYGTPKWDHRMGMNLEGFSVAPKMARFVQHGYDIVGYLHGHHSQFKKEAGRLMLDVEKKFPMYQEYELTWIAIKKKHGLCTSCF